MFAHHDQKGRLSALYSSEEEWEALKDVCDRDELANTLYHGIPIYILKTENRTPFWKRWLSRLNRRLFRATLQFAHRLLARVRQRLEKHQSES